MEKMVFSVRKHLLRKLFTVMCAYITPSKKYKTRSIHQQTPLYLCQE